MNWSRRWINPVLEKEFRLRMRTIRSPLAVLFYLAAMSLLALGFMYMTIIITVIRLLTRGGARSCFILLAEPNWS